MARFFQEEQEKEAVLVLRSTGFDGGEETFIVGPAVAHGQFRIDRTSGKGMVYQSFQDTNR